MSDDTSSEDEQRPIEPGLVVYDHEGDQLGVITKMASEGFEVSIREEIEGVDEDGYAEEVDAPGTEGKQARETEEESLRDSQQEHNPGQEFGEGYIMWRCNNCGEMGELEDGLPTECPNCDSSDVEKWKED